MNRSYLKAVLLVTIVILLGTAVSISRDYQDGWILEGLEIPFLLFVGAYALTFFGEKKVSSLVLLAVIARFTFLLIPNLKYVWFQGTNIDQYMQYGLANYVHTNGYIAPLGPLNEIYSSTPIIHLAFATFSSILNIPIADSMKYLPVFLSPIYPLVTYLIIKNLKFERGDTLLKYALFISSIPLSSEKFTVTGSQFGVLLAFLTLGCLVLFFQKFDRRNFLIFLFLVFILAGTHSSSSVLFTIFLFSVMILQKIPFFRLKSYLRVPEIFTVILICVGWLFFQAKFTLETVVKLAFVAAPQGATPSTEQVPLRFFQLVQVNVVEALKTVIVFYGSDIFLLLLTIGGLIILLKRLKKLDNNSKFLFLIFSVMLLYMPIAFLAKLGPFRVLHFATSLFPIFIGIFILLTCKRKTWLAAFLFSLILILVPLRLYSCQPLIPSANVLLENLDESQPMVYVTGVNSIYQRQMIGFASNYVRGRIGCDTVTLNQVIGLAGFNYSSTYLEWYYPLDDAQSFKTCDVFLIHFPGVSGPFNEQAELRTNDLISEAIYNSTVIYTNGESFILDWNPS